MPNEIGILVINGGKYFSDPSKTTIVDLMDVNRSVLPKLDRRGMCLCCHKSIPNGNLAVSAMTHVAQMAGIKIDNKMHGDILNKLLNLGAWIQVLLPVVVGSIGL